MKALLEEPLLERDKEIECLCERILNQRGDVQTIYVAALLSSIN